MSLSTDPPLLEVSPVNNNIVAGGTFGVGVGVGGVGRGDTKLETTKSNDGTKVGASEKEALLMAPCNNSTGLLDDSLDLPCEVSNLKDANEQLRTEMEFLRSKLFKLERIVSSMNTDDDRNECQGEEVKKDDRNNPLDKDDHRSDHTTQHLPNDTFSFMIMAHPCSTPFALAITVVLFQLATFSLAGFNVMNVEGRDNPFNIPPNVNAEVRVTQLIAIVIAVITQDDLRTGFSMFLGGYKNLPAKTMVEENQEEHMYSTFAWWKWTLSIVSRLLEGGLGLTVTFLLIMTAETVVDLLLNFTAMEFVSQLDDVCYYMSSEGFFGKENNRATEEISDKTYRTNGKSRNVRRFLVLAVLFIALLSGWLIVANTQKTGKYLCSTIFVQFGDDFIPTLGSFSGLYDRRTTQRGIFDAQFVEYVDRHSGGLAVFGYCNSLQAWTFRFGEGNDDPCEDWVTRSEETLTFDLTQAASSQWFVQNSESREIILQHLYLSCYDCQGGDNDSCGGHGVCHHAVCSCNVGWYGLRCEFYDPCPTLQFDERFGPFRDNHRWSTTFDILTDDHDNPVHAYYRPVYANEYSSGKFDIIVFSGRRWLATSSVLMKIVRQENQTTKQALAKYFAEEFHIGLSSFSFSFASGPLDVGTPMDRNSPVSVEWNSLRTLHVNTSSMTETLAQTATSIENALLCKVCNNRDNPCLYDGECINGTCHCSIGAFGSICQIPPVGNGHCDLFYNTLEFEYDGGDCCESTCISTRDFTCGVDTSGFVDLGYFFCHEPKEDWRPNGENIQGEIASASGVSVRLSDNGEVLAISEPMALNVKVFDKAGSQWIQRESTIKGPQGVMYGTSMAMTPGPIHMVNNAMSMIPLVLVTSTAYVNTGFAFVYECTNTGCTQNGEDINVFEADIPINVVVDISTDGTVFAAGACPAPVAAFATFDLYPLVIFERSHLGWNQHKVDLVFDGSTGVYSVALSGNATIMAVASYIVEFSPNRGISMKSEAKHVYSRNGFSWSQRGRTIPGGNIHPALLYNAQGRSMSLSDDGNVLAFGLWLTDHQQVAVRVLVWDESESDWMQRGSNLHCGDFELQGWSVSLSSDGGTVAMAAADYNGADSWAASVGLNGTVCAFFWTGVDWDPLGRGVQGGHMSSVELSGDGSVLAVGRPFATMDNTGLTSVYDFPRDDCPNHKSLLRVSLTTGDVPSATSWDIFSNKTVDHILSGGPYVVEGITYFLSFVEETCVWADDCLIFTIYDKLDLNTPPEDDGIEPPGGHVLFLDGKEIVRGRLERAVERVYIGNCQTCPVETVQFSLLIQTCTAVSWSLIDSSGETFFSDSSLLDYSDRLDNDCSFASQTTYWEEICLSLDRCMFFSIVSLPMESLMTATSDNLLYRLFLDDEQITWDSTFVFANGKESDMVTLIPIGKCDP